jgi:3-dehydroquinate synthase class II
MTTTCHTVPLPPLQVHAYLQAPGGRTSYLSELSSGSSVLVADAAGATRTEVVGRIKLEARPLVRGRGWAGQGRAGQNRT